MELSSKKGKRKKADTKNTFWTSPKIPILGIVIAFISLIFVVLQYIDSNKINTVVITAQPNVTLCVDELIFGYTQLDPRDSFCSSNQLNITATKSDRGPYTIRIDVINLGLGPATDMSLETYVIGGEWKNPIGIEIDDEKGHYPAGAYADDYPSFFMFKKINSIGPQQKASIKYSFEEPVKIPEEIRIKLYSKKVLITEKNITIKLMLPPS